MRRSFMKAAMLAAMLGAISSPGSATAGASTSSTVNKDAIKNDIKPSSQRQRTISKGTGGNGWSTEGLFKNQRQYRKHIRQNPHLLKSKKFRGNN